MDSEPSKLHKPIIFNESMIDEIRAQDIYTLHSSAQYPVLPSVTTATTCNANPCENLTSRVPVLRKSNQKCRSIMKKLSIQQMKRSVLNLPALIEEDLTYLPSVPVYTSEQTPFEWDQDINSAFESHSDAEMNTSINYKMNEDTLNVENNCDGFEDEGCCFLVFDDDDSWVDLSKHAEPPSSPNMPHTPTSPDRVTPLPFGNGEEYLRLLREAQKESNQSSARVSLASSRRDTPRDSPKSPPNSPNTEMVFETEETPFKGVYINYYNREGDFVRVEKNIETDWIWDWSSRPDMSPPKEWRFVHPRKGTGRGASIRRLMVGNSSLFSRDVLYTLLITNVLSLILGTGIGIWLSKRSGGGTVTLNTVSIN